MAKLEQHLNDRWVPYSYQKTYSRETLHDGSTRLAIGLPAEEDGLFARLLEELDAPFVLLYILPIPRKAAAIGRYQSPDLSAASAQLILTEFGSYFSGDAWHDLWAYSPSRRATLVWDRHDIIYAYGPLERYETVLDFHGFASGKPSIPSPHAHQRRRQFDAIPELLLQRFEWTRSDLRPEDEQ
jgi:hypothetical protein